MVVLFLINSFPIKRGIQSTGTQLFGLVDKQLYTLFPRKETSLSLSLLHRFSSIDRTFGFFDRIPQLKFSPPFRKGSTRQRLYTLTDPFAIDSPRFPPLDSTLGSFDFDGPM